MTDEPKGTLFRLIASDLIAKAQWLYGSATRRMLLKALFTDGTPAMILYRLMQACHRRCLTPLAMLLGRLNTMLCGCIIGRGAHFGPRFVLIHSHGVVINTRTRGGTGITLEHQVTLGAEKGQAPILGDEVFVGAGAKVIGGVRIGSRVRIGANAVVVGDLPDDVTAVGVPARIVTPTSESA